jgi:fibronectin-binding autotransporter adhesin
MKLHILSSARLSIPLATAIASLLSAKSASALDGTWLGSSGNWADAGTWAASTIADGTGFTANFTGVDISADQTVTLAADRTIGNITFTDATTSSNNLLITGSNLLTLDVTSGAPAINVTQSGRTLTINSVIAGTDGLQKTGAGALTLNGSAVNTFTGGLSVNGGTLTLDSNNLAAPTHLVNATNALQINNGVLTLTGNATTATVQTFAGATLGAGNNTLNITKGATATSATLNLGTLTATAGSVTTINPGTIWATGVLPTAEIINVSGITGKTLPVAPGVANWINVNAGLYYRQSVNPGAVRWVNVDNLGQLVAIPATIASQGVSGTVTVARQISTANITLTGNAQSYGLVVNSDNAARTLSLGIGSFTYTINGILGVNTNKAIIAPGTGGTLVIGSERNLVVNMDNTGGLDINAPIVNNGGGASSVTIASTIPSGTPGTVTFGGANTYTGTTNINRGTLSLTGSLTGGGAVSTSGTGILSQSSTGVISGASTFSQSSSGTSVLGGSNTFTGATSITGGVLSLTNATPLGASPGISGTSGITINAGTVLQSATAGTNPSTTIAAPITLGAGGNSTLRIGQGAGSNTHTFNINGAIAGATNNLVFTTTTGSFNNGASVFVLGAPGIYTGNTLITTGNGGNNPVTVRAGSGVVNALPTTTVLSFGQVTGGGSGRSLTYDLNGNNQTLAGLSNALAVPSDRNFRVSSTNPATLTINNTDDFTFGGATLETDFSSPFNTTTSAQIIGAISLTKSGPGTFTLDGVLTNVATGLGNSFTGATRVLGGILVLGETLSIQNSTFNTQDSIAGDASNGLRSTVTALRLGGITGNKDFEDVFTTTSGGYGGLTLLTLNVAGSDVRTYSADLGDGAGAMNITKIGTGTQIFAAAQSATGFTTGTAGLLLATTPAALPGYNSPGKVIFNGGTIGVQVGGSGWATADVDTLLSTATKTSGSLGVDTTNGNFTQWTPLTPTNLGSLGLTKLGPNDLTLNQPNTYAGTTTVNEGTLTLTDPLALQNSPLNVAGGSVILSGLTTLTLGGLTGSSNFGATGLTNLTLNAPEGALFNYSGIIADGTPGMTVTKTGLGAQALTGANTYTGATQIDGGILTFGNKASKTAATATAAAAGSIGLGVHASDAAFYAAADVDALFNTNSLTGFSLNSASGVAIDTTNAGGGSFDQTVALTAARSLSKTGTGTLVLSQINSYSGATSVLAGTLSLTGSLTGGGAISTTGAGVLTQSAAGVISGASTVTHGSSGISTLAGANDYTGVTNINLGQITIASAAALGTTAGNTIVASGGRLGMSTASLSVAEPLTITGTGTTATNGAITFGGGFTGMALTGPITLGGAARIQADGNTGSALSGGVSLGSNALTINADGGATHTIDTTAITGTGGSLIKSGSGTLVLAAANSYTGATTVNLGTLSITDNGALGTTDSATTINGGNGTNAVTLTLSNATSDLTVAEPLNFFASTAGRSQLSNGSARNHTLSGPINVTSDTNLVQFTSNSTGSITVSGDITGTMTNGAVLFLRGTSTSASNLLTGNINMVGTLAKTDAGTWQVGAPGKTYSWTDTLVAVGSLKMGLANVLPSATVVTLGNSTGGSTGILDLNGHNQTVGGLIYNGQGVSTGTRTITSATPAVLTVNNATNFITTGTNVSTNNIVLTGAIGLTKQGAGTLALNGVNTNSGDTTVNDGILSLTKADSALDANTGNDASTVTIAAAAGATLDLAYTGTDEVDKLFIGGVQKSAGVWGAIGSGAPNTDAKITGTGTLTVATGPSSNNYASWAALQVPPVTEGANGDDDKDGVKNLIEYALADGQELGSLTGNSLSFTKRGAPYGGDLTYEIETSENLGVSDPWATVTPTVDNATTISYTLQDPGDNFARLKVIQTP